MLNKNCKYLLLYYGNSKQCFGEPSDHDALVIYLHYVFAFLKISNVYQKG
jgi:hypothetical protein